MERFNRMDGKVAREDREEPEKSMQRGEKTKQSQKNVMVGSISQSGMDGLFGMSPNQSGASQGLTHGKESRASLLSKLRSSRGQEGIADSLKEEFKKWSAKVQKKLEKELERKYIEYERNIIDLETQIARMEQSSQRFNKTNSQDKEALVQEGHKTEKEMNVIREMEERSMEWLRDMKAREHHPVLTDSHISEEIKDNDLKRAWLRKQLESITAENETLRLALAEKRSKLKGSHYRTTYDPLVDTGELSIPRTVDDDPNKPSDEEQRKISQQEISYLEQKLSKLQAESAKREENRAKTIKAIDEIRQNRHRIESLLLTMAEEKKEVEKEIQLVMAQKGGNKPEGGSYTIEELLENNTRLREERRKLLANYEDNSQNSIRFYCEQIMINQEGMLDENGQQIDLLDDPEILEKEEKLLKLRQARAQREEELEAYFNSLHQQINSDLNPPKSQ